MLDKKDMVRLVEFCGGDKDMVDEWLDHCRDIEIRTFEELLKVPEVARKNYDWLIYRSDAPEFYDYFIDELFGDYGLYGKGESISLLHIDSVLNDLDRDGEKKRVETIKKELVNLRFNSMRFDW